MAELFPLPDVGEGLTEAEIVSWRVAVGDVVEVNDIVCEIETAKSLVELPIPYAGVVEELLGGEGETIEVGTPIIRIGSADATEASAAASESISPSAESAEPTKDTGTTTPPKRAATTPSPEGASDSPAPKPPATTPAPKRTAQSTAQTQDPAEQQALVGSGPRADAARHRPRTRTTAMDVVGEIQEEETDTQLSGRFGSGDLAEILSRANPPVRALAKRLGVAVWELVGSGKNGQITRDDVERQAREKRSRRASGAGLTRSELKPAQRPLSPVEQGLLYEGPRDQNVQVRGVRKATALNVSASASHIPHVSVFKEIDITRTMELRSVLKNQAGFQGLSVSPMLFAATAIIRALRIHHQVNASWQETHYTLHNYVNLGIAAATPRGLMVPVIKEAQTYSLRGLAAAITQLTIDAREGTTTPADMLGGTISITNIGPLGLDSGTPILPPGQASIVVLGAVRKKPWVMPDGQIVARDVMTIGGSFDHRLIDGDLAGAFISEVAAALEEPGLMLDF